MPQIFATEYDTRFSFLYRTFVLFLYANLFCATQQLNIYFSSKELQLQKKWAKIDYDQDNNKDMHDFYTLLRYAKYAIIGKENQEQQKVLTCYLNNPCKSLP